MNAPNVSVIIPTLNEAVNLPTVVPRIAAALKNRSYEILVIDDASADGTPAVCAQLSKSFPLALHIRSSPKDGLSGAVLLGMSLARGEILVVMDADLQHPPEKLPQLIEPLESGDADFALGSRYIPGGSLGETWGPLRRLNSRIATWLARPFAGRAHDPMSGFFAIRRETYQRARRLTPLGYKVALELMCKCRVGTVREIPIHFSARQYGDSKLTVTQQFKYLEHLSRLYDFCFPRASPILKFLIALACGWLVAFGPYLKLVGRWENPVTSTALAYLLAIAATAVFQFRYVRTQREFLAIRRPWADFFFISLAEWATCVLCALWLANRVPHLRPLELFAIPFGAATVTRYILRKEMMQDIRGLRKDLRTEHGDDERPAPAADSAKNALASRLSLAADFRKDGSVKRRRVA